MWEITTSSRGENAHAVIEAVFSDEFKSMVISSNEEREEDELPSIATAVSYVSKGFEAQTLLVH